MSVYISSPLQGTHANDTQDCKGGTCQSQKTVPTGDDQYPGQRAGKVEEEICVLDSGTTHRRERSRERTMGRDACEPSVGRVGEEPGDKNGIDNSQLFFVHTEVTSNYWDWWMGNGMIYYDRSRSDEVLGDTPEDEEEDEGGFNEHRCFNCGSPTHFLNSCHLPHDHALINLSRQLAAFFRNNDGKQAMQRIHVVEGWKQQRLDWLSTFEPGEIRGSLLRDALGLNNDDAGEDVPWLSNMSYWGYPPGWAGVTDPKEKMRSRILGEGDDPTLLGSTVQNGAEVAIIIFGDDGTEESLDLTVKSTAFEPMAKETSPGEFRRWAVYPKSQFLYTLLPVFSGTTLPPPESESFTLERQQIWNNIISQPPPPPPCSPPPLPPPPTLPEAEDDMDMSD